MNLQWSGLVLAVMTFGTIALGHVGVRKLNYLYGTKPAPYFLILGLSLMIVSLLVNNELASAALGIIGVTTLWDAIELVRQEERIRRGQAPENPNRRVQAR